MTEHPQREGMAAFEARWWMALVAGVILIALASLLEPYLGEFNERAALATYGVLVFVAFCVSVVRKLRGR